MGLVRVLGDLWGSGGVALAILIVGVLTAVLRFLKWLIEFVTERLDVGRVQLGQRLEHVEQELDAFREAAMLLLSELAKIDPDNAALFRVARMLRQTPPITGAGLDELERRLAAMPGKEGGQTNDVAA
jgi:hypothetical protein